MTMIPDAQLAEIIGCLDCNVRRFPTELDLPAIRDNFVALFSLIAEKPVANEVKPQTSVKVQLVQTRKAVPVETKRRSTKWNILNVAASATVVLVASVAAVTAVVRSAS